MQRRSLEVVSVAILALVAIVVFYRVYSFGQERFFTVDEYQYAHATWLVSEGERPYVDFYEHHFPLSYVAHAPLVWPDGAFAEKVLRLRALVFGYLLGVSLLLGWATWRRTRDRCASLLALAFPAAFGFSLMSAVDYRADNFGAYLFVGGWCLLDANRAESGKRGFAVLAGVALGLAVLMTQKMLFVAGASALVALAYDRFRARRVAVPSAPSGESCTHEAGASERIAVTGRTWAQVSIELRRHRPDADLVIADDVLAGIRAIKDEQEIALMRASASIVDTVLAEVAPRVVAGITEIELASEVDLRMRQHGSLGASFDTGVWGMGPALTRDASVRVSTDALAEGTGVSFDFGAITRGYCSDFGRTVHIGEPSAEYVTVHEVVMAAQEAARQAAVPGATGGQVLEAARRVIDEAGYGDGFRHRVGHCIGLDVHEEPFLSAEDTTPLQPGMLFTIEPSIFLPGRVGVRVEDVFLLTETGAVNINATDHELKAND